MPVGADVSLPHANPDDVLDPEAVQARHRALKTQEHPLLKQSPATLVSGLQQRIAENGTRRTLTQFYVHHLVRSYLQRQLPDADPPAEPMAPDSRPETDPGLPPGLLQFGIGIALQTDTETTTEHDFQTFVDYLLALLTWYRQRANPVEIESTGKTNPYFNILWRELTTDRFVDGFQYLEKGYRAYKPWEDEMEALLGFSIEDAVYYTLQLREPLQENILGADKEVAQWARSLLSFSERALEIGAAVAWVDKDTLTAWCDDSSRFLAFLDRLSCDPGVSQEYVSPLDLNPLEQAPFIRSGSAYLLPFPRTLVFAIANTFYYDLIAAQDTGRFADRYGEWLETWTQDCLETVFDPSQVFANYTYECDGRTVEGDLLVLTEDLPPIVLECKAKTLSLATREGSLGGQAAIDAAAEQSIGRATEQAHRLVSGVQMGSISEVTTSDGRSISMSEQAFDEAIEWVVLGESYGPLATKGFARILDLPTTPFVCDVFDLQVILELLASPAALVDYLRRRIRLTETQYQLADDQFVADDQYPNLETKSPDEIDYLGLYERHGGGFPPAARHIVGAGDHRREDIIDQIRRRGGFEYQH